VGGAAADGQHLRPFAQNEHGTSRQGGGAFQPRLAQSRHAPGQPFIGHRFQQVIRRRRFVVGDQGAHGISRVALTPPAALLVMVSLAFSP